MPRNSLPKAWHQLCIAQRDPSATSFVSWREPGEPACSQPHGQQEGSSTAVHNSFEGKALGTQGLSASWVAQTTKSHCKEDTLRRAQALQPLRPAHCPQKHRAEAVGARQSFHPALKPAFS